MPIKTGLLTLSLLLTCLFLPDVHAGEPIEQQNQTQMATLDIQNMTCPLCQFTIKKALQSVNGVHHVNIDYDSKIAKIGFDPRQTSLQDLIKATTDAGYPASARIKPQ